VCLSTAPPPGKRRLVIATTARARQLDALELTGAFDVVQELGGLTDEANQREVLRTHAPTWKFTDAHLSEILVQYHEGISVKYLLQAADMAVQKSVKQQPPLRGTHLQPQPNTVPLAIWQTCLAACAR
jgi:hypothetical protein